MLNEQMCGIYKITNTINEKFYIGSSVNLEKRFKRHWYELKNNNHCNKHLQSAVNKYGLNNFTFEILDICESKDVLKVEQEKIDDLLPQYNICKTAGNCMGVKASQETRNKISKIHKGKKLSNETKDKIRESKQGKNNPMYGKESPMFGKFGSNNPLSKKVIQLTKYGEFVNAFSCIREAERETGIPNTNISKVCKGERKYKSAGGYLWRYA